MRKRLLPSKEGDYLLKMKIACISLLALCLCVGGCGKSESERVRELREQEEEIKRNIENLKKAQKALKALNDAKR